MKLPLSALGPCLLSGYLPRLASWLLALWRLAPPLSFASPPPSTLRCSLFPGSTSWHGMAMRWRCIAALWECGWWRFPPHRHTRLAPHSQPHHGVLLASLFPSGDIRPLWTCLLVSVAGTTHIQSVSQTTYEYYSSTYVTGGVTSPSYEYYFNQRHPTDEVCRSSIQ